MSHLGFRFFQLATFRSNVSLNLIRRLSTVQKSVDGTVTSFPHDEDILLKSIKYSKESADVLHYIGKHHSIMNLSHILQAFKVIFSIQKSEGTVMSNGEVLDSTQFRTLCNSLKHRVRSLENNEIIDVLKTLSYLGVPASSKLSSILLNLLASRVNELSLQQIVFLDFLMKDFKPIPIVDALKIALPVVFQANLKLKLDRDNVHEACSYLYYATRKKLPVEAIDSLVDLIMELRYNMDLQAASSVIKSICDSESADTVYRPLLHHAFDVVLSHINECSFNQLDIIMSKCFSKYSKSSNFYHEEFVNSVCNFVISKDCGLEEGIWTLKKLNKWGHVDTALLEYLAEKVEPQLLSSSGLKEPLLFTLVKGLATADYKPKNWETLEPIIIKQSENLFLSKSSDGWMSYVRDLCTLGTWPLSIIERLFHPEFLESFMKNNTYFLDQLQLLSLYQEVSTLCPEQYRPYVPPQTLETIRDINGKHIMEFPLLNFLSKGLGGSSCIASGVYTKLGHYLHHVIVLKKGGFPASLDVNTKSNSVVYIDDIVQLKEENYPVAVMYLPPSFYCCNIDKLKGTVQMNLNSISALGLTVVPISSLRWEALLEHEKIPYLMREINEKFDFNSSQTIIS